MNKYNFNHNLTPKPLEDINQQLESVLSAESLDDELLRTLIEKRDELVLAHLESISAPQKQSFAKQEYEINKVLSTLIEAHLSASLKQLSGLLRGRKAVDKYK